MGYEYGFTTSKGLSGSTPYKATDKVYGGIYKQVTFSLRIQAFQAQSCLPFTRRNGAFRVRQQHMWLGSVHTQGTLVGILFLSIGTSSLYIMVQKGGHWWSAVFFVFSVSGISGTLLSRSRLLITCWVELILILTTTWERSSEIEWKNICSFMVGNDGPWYVHVQGSRSKPL